MSYFKRQNSSNSYTYSKLNKEDPEDTVHRKAQFLIYKAMEEAETVGGGSHSHVKKTTTMSFLRMRFCKVKVKIGSRFKSLRRRVFSSVSVSKAATYIHIIKQLKTCNKRLFGAAGKASTVAGIPSLLI